MAPHLKRFYETNQFKSFIYKIQICKGKRNGVKVNREMETKGLIRLKKIM